MSQFEGGAFKNMILNEGSSVTCYADQREEQRCEVEMLLGLQPWEQRVVRISLSTKSSDPPKFLKPSIEQPKRQVDPQPKYEPQNSSIDYVPRGPMMPTGSAESILPYHNGGRVLSEGRWSEPLHKLMQRYHDLVVRSDLAQLILTSHDD
jgi:hypothetical protein